MVIELAFNSNDPSLNPAEVYIFLFFYCLKRNKKTKCFKNLFFTSCVEITIFYSMELSLVNTIFCTTMYHEYTTLVPYLWSLRY